VNGFVILERLMMKRAKSTPRLVLLVRKESLKYLLHTGNPYFEVPPYMTIHLVSSVEK
jgi:hypothetical protein